MRPRLSIIIATFNAGETLQRCLDSIFSQHFTDWELLVSDGGSTDDTVRILESHASRIAWWQSQPDGGIYDAWNQALAHAQGEYVVFLGADDAWRSEQTLASIFESMGNRTYDLVTGLGVLMTSQGHGYHTFGKAWNFRRLGRRMAICHPGSLHRRDLFSRFGAFDTSYRICADYDFLLRLPADTTSLHLEVPFVNVADAGISRSRRGLMLREKYRAQANCPRIGRFKASFNYVDKLWRIPIARLLGIPH